MRTTISIDDALIDELMRVAPSVSRSEAMRRAVEEYIRNRRLEEFMKLAGSELVDMGWREAERSEMAKLKKHGRKQ